MATLITLLTDFGDADSYLGEVKGVLLSRVHGAALADITHQVSPGTWCAAQYILSRAGTRSRGTCTSHGGPGWAPSAARLAAAAGGARLSPLTSGLLSFPLTPITVAADSADAAPTAHAPMCSFPRQVSSPSALP
jgi:hypothetical protein